MDLRVKVILCALPFILAAYVWFSLTSPILATGQTQSGELEDKRKQEVDLKSKLLDFNRLQAERKTLGQEIAKLRDSVPKVPDVDILMIDLEKMALDSGVDIVSFEKPSSEKLKRIEQTSQPTGPSQATDKKAKPAKGAKAEQKVETGLSTISLQVGVVGDYEHFIDLMKKVEAYERVIGVNSVTITPPKKESGEKDKDKAKQADDAYKMLNISMVITAYYLP